MMKFLKYVPAVAVLLFAHSATAQNDFVQDELNAIREDIKILQRQIYRGAKNSDFKPVEEHSSYTASADVKQLGEYDQIIRDINGKVDELEHKISEVEQRIETINRDIDTRLKLIEGKPIKAGNNSGAGITKHAAPVANNAPKSVTGDKVYGSNLAPIKTNDSSVHSIYAEGMNAVYAKDYDTAAENFRTIISQYPNDTLAGNAQYWLGEVYYAKGDFTNAAINFAEGYKKFKDNPKAPDNLLKLGLSMKNLNKNSEACSAFTNLPREFSSAPKDIKDRAADEAKKLGCK